MAMTPQWAKLYGLKIIIKSLFTTTKCEIEAYAKSYRPIKKSPPCDIGLDARVAQKW